MEDFSLALLEDGRKLRVRMVFGEKPLASRGISQNLLSSGGMMQYEYVVDHIFRYVHKEYFSHT
jgi:hypothetical protein